MKFLIPIYHQLNIEPSMAIVMALVGSILLISTVSTKIWQWAKPNALAQEIWVRTRSWWIMTLIFFGSLLTHPLLSYMALAYLSFMVLRELYAHLPFHISDRKAMGLGYLCIFGLFLLNVSTKGTHLIFLGWITGVSFIGIPLFLLFGNEGKSLVSRWSLFTVALAISVWSLGYLGLILNLPVQENSPSGGKGLLLFLICITELNDVFQFLIGKWKGKHLLIPHISPRKTWEGFMGGFVGSMVLAYFLSFLLPFSNWVAMGLGATLSILGLLGDLLISAVKRELNLKDMGSTIPGHGGVLDRVDSLLLSAPVFYFLITSSSLSCLFN